MAVEGMMVEVVTMVAVEVVVGGWEGKMVASTAAREVEQEEETVVEVEQQEDGRR